MNYIKLSFLYTICFALLFCGASIGYSQSIANIDAWTVDLSKPSAKSIYITRGETRVIQPTAVYGSAPWVFPTGASVTMRYKSSGMTNAYYQVAGSVYVATSGVLRVLWTPSQEGLANAYSYEIEAATGTTAQISISGSIFLRDSLATVSSATNPNAIAVFDWNTISNRNSTNGPWVSVTVDSTARSMATAASNHAEEAYQLALTNSPPSTFDGYATDLVARASALDASNRINAVGVTATNGYQVATNALSIAQALTITVDSLPTSNNVFEVWREMAATSSVVNAENALNLVSPNGWIAMMMSNGVLWVTEVTNTTSLSVVHVSGDGYNGPVLGTAFVGPPILLDGGPYWKWANDDFNFISDSDEDHPGEIPTKLFGTSVDTALDPDGMWIVNPGTFTLNAFSGIAVGSFTVDWLKSTNTYSIGNGVTNINGKSGAVIVLTAADVGAVSNALWNGTSVAQTNGTLYITDDDSRYLTNVPSTVAVARINFSTSAYTNKLSILNDGTSWMFEGIGKSFYYSGYNHTWKSSHSGQELVWGYNGLACNSANMTLGYSGAPWVLTASGIIMNNYRVSAITNVLSSSTNALVTSGAISNYLSGGTVHIKLPTATNGLASGELWNNSGTLSVMP